MTWKIPPQYVNIDEASPFPRQCPATDIVLDASDDPGLYDVESTPKADVADFANLSDSWFAAELGLSN